MVRYSLALAAAAAFAAAVPRAGSAADAQAGAVVFKRCAICHTVAAGAGNRVGPELHGVFGRKAGSVEHFAYSEAMKNSGIVWNDDTIAAYLRDPRKVVPGNRMAFPGMTNDKDIADLIAYLHQSAQ